MNFGGFRPLRLPRIFWGKLYSHGGFAAAIEVHTIRNGWKMSISQALKLSAMYQRSRCMHHQASYTWSRLIIMNFLASRKQALHSTFSSAFRFVHAMHEAHLAKKVTGYCFVSSLRNAAPNGRKAWEHVYGHCSRERFYVQYGLRKPLLPPFNLFVRAVTLAFSRSQIPLGLLAVTLGVFNQCIAEAEPLHGNSASFSSSQIPLSLLSSFVHAIFESVMLVSRALYLLVLFMPVILITPFADVFGGRFRQAWLELVHHSLELAGAAFIKWGQWAATRPDLFPRDLCLELSKLQTKAPAHKYSHTVRTVEKAFGKKINDIFEEFEEQPIASGSIAQVHKGTLRYSYPGRKSRPVVVAVKVRHPGVSEIIKRDFILIKGIASLSTLIPGLRWLRLDESVQQFAVFMLTQVDLAREAAHLSRFLYNFRHWKDVSFPRPLYPLVHPAVLVETYEQGESVSRFVELPERTKINSTLAHIGTHTLLKMLLVDNFIHADMHPGNILVRVKKKRLHPGTKSSATRPQVVFLDVGMTAELSNRDRVNVLDFFKAVALRDGRAAAECALRFSGDQTCPNPRAFIEEVESSFRLWASEDGGDIHPGDCLQDLLEQVRRHRVNIDGEVCTVMVTTMILEGWQRKLDPDYNIMHTLQSLIFKVDWANSLLYTMNGIVAP
ncbi:hypothetical protein KP509_14G083600 [Ceratopteris richardii]|uniref:ABC1 atypical kinase-like domain-containing protein n=2 Tax=Ceratopteris richardii TaxID=49495 RepID=A0A8T2TEV9_CERRI|nr:hypothetical protein KP509_14G083600 [Ceratopteris richardii]